VPGEDVRIELFDRGGAAVDPARGGEAVRVEERQEGASRFADPEVSRPRDAGVVAGLYEPRAAPLVDDLRSGVG
jgi:hypothetical protein